MQDDNTPKGKIESYKVNMDFFFLEDYRKKPDTNKYSFLGYVDEIKCNLDEKSLRNFLNEHKINIQ
jgi:hypothetical protein